MGDGGVRKPSDYVCRHHGSKYMDRKPFVGPGTEIPRLDKLPTDGLNPYCLICAFKLLTNGYVKLAVAMDHIADCTKAQVQVVLQSHPAIMENMKLPETEPTKEEPREGKKTRDPVH